MLSAAMHKNKERLSIVIVTYNSADVIVKCLDSALNAIDQRQDRIVVIDNASPDGTSEIVAGRYPGILLIQSEVNQGFASAVNAATESVHSQWILLLNPDTQVNDDSIGNLVAFAASRPERVIYGGRTTFPDGQPNPTSCWNQITPWSAFCRATGMSALFPRSRTLNPEAVGCWANEDVWEVDIVTGCFFLIRTSDWRALGGFDPRFWMYGEEADLCLRSIKRYGVRPLITSQAEIMHMNGAVTGSVDRHVWIAKARTSLIRKHWRRGWRDWGLLMVWSEAAVRAAAAICLYVVPVRDRVAKQRRWMALWRARKDCLRGY